MTSFPTSAVTYATLVDFVDSPLAAHENSQDDEITAIENYLLTGINIDLYNYLINGGFDFAQRQAAGTLTTVADKSWGADRWQQFAENASWQYNRNDATGESGLTSKFYGLFKKITNTGKGIFVQKVSGNSSIPLRGKTVIFQIKMKASASKTIRMAVLELQTAGTVDTFPAAIASAFGANTTDPTWGANVAVITAVESKAVTTAWQSFSVSVTVPSNSKNVVCAIWTDSQFAANDTLSVAEAGLFVSSTIQAWKPRLYAQELALCQARYEKSYNIDTAPGTVTSTGIIIGRVASNTVASGEQYATYKFSVPKPRTPTVTSYSYNGVTTQASRPDTTADLGASSADVIYVSENGWGARNNTGGTLTTSGLAVLYHYTADAEIA